MENSRDVADDDDTEKKYTLSLQTLCSQKRPQCATTPPNVVRCIHNIHVLHDRTSTTYNTCTNSIAACVATTQSTSMHILHRSEAPYEAHNIGAAAAAD